MMPQETASKPEEVSEPSIEGKIFIYLINLLIFNVIVLITGHWVNQALLSNEISDNECRS